MAKPACVAAKESIAKPFACDNREQLDQKKQTMKIQTNTEQ